MPVSRLTVRLLPPTLIRWLTLGAGWPAVLKRTSAEPPSTTPAGTGITKGSLLPGVATGAAGSQAAPLAYTTRAWAGASRTQTSRRWVSATLRLYCSRARS